MNDFKNETIVITGASRGMGRVFALHLAKLGANVGIICRNLDSYKEYSAEIAQFTASNVYEELKQTGARVYAAIAELTNFEDVQRAINEITEELGPITGLVCNAGGGLGPITEGKPSDMDLDIFDQVIHKNLYTVANTIKAVAPIMKKNGKGSIVTMSSHSGQEVNGDGSYSHYIAAKAAITQYTKSLAQELGPYGVRANVMSPGYIATARLKQRFEEAGEEKYLKNTALRRYGTAEDCAKVVEFLLSDMSSYVTGTVIEVNGGTTGRIG